VLFRRVKTDNWFYIVIAIFSIVLILLTILYTTNTLIKAYIEDDFLVNGWFESGDRSYSEQLFGLEKQSTFKYIFDSNSDGIYTDFLTVTSIKTIFMINEQELLDETVKTIFNAASERNITIINTTQFTSSRYLKNDHNTYFIILNGTQIINGFIEKIKIIGETWNCAYSGTSIICIGFVQTTDVKNGNNSENLINWAKIIGDKEGTFNKIFNDVIYMDYDGLIFNVKCH
jgi:hypothetical protein